MECNRHTLVAHVAALHHSSALLLKYRVGPDNQQGWFLPNDDLHHLEHPEQAARRILKEQAGIDGNVETRRDRVFRGEQSDLASYLRLPRVHPHDEYITGEGSCRAEMVRDRQIAASRGLRSPWLGKDCSRQTCPRESTTSDNVKPQIGQREIQLRIQDFKEAVLR